MSESSESESEVENTIATISPPKLDQSLKVTLRSKCNPEFTIEVGPPVISWCDILKTVAEHSSDNSEAVEVEMTPSQLKKFVEFHNHFGNCHTIKREHFKWTQIFFAKMSDTEFKELCWSADFLDSQRFLESAGDFVLSKIQDMKVPEMRKYLNIENDYSITEQKAMKDKPHEFFCGVFVEENITFFDKFCFVFEDMIPEWICDNKIFLIGLILLVLLSMFL